MKDNDKLPDLIKYSFIIGLVGIVIAIIVRLSLYGVFGADTGVMEINAQGEIIFLGLDMIRGMVLLKNIQTHGASTISEASKDNSIFYHEFGSEDTVLPYYIDENHPCNSFFDSVCGLFDSDGTQSTIEDIANSEISKRSLVTEKKSNHQHYNKSKSRTSGTFYDVSFASETIHTALLNDMPINTRCIRLVNGLIQEMLTGNNNQIIDSIAWNSIIIPKRKSSNSMINNLYSAGLEMPIVIEIKKMFHVSEFAIHMRLNLLPIMDITFNPNVHSDPVFQSSLISFYENLLAENDKLMNEIETVEEYMNICFKLDELSKSTENASLIKQFLLLLQDIIPLNQTNVPYGCFPTDLIPGVVQLNSVLDEHKDASWDYFHRLSLFYNTIQIIEMASVVTNSHHIDSFKTTPMINKNFTFGIQHDINQIKDLSFLHTSELHKFYYNVPKFLDEEKRSDIFSKHIFSTKLIMKEKLKKINKGIQMVDLYHKNNSGYYFASSNGVFSIKREANVYHISKMIQFKSNFKNDMTINQLTSNICGTLLNNILFDSINRDYAILTEINLNSKNSTQKSSRSTDVTLLVERILKSTTLLINQSTFQDPRTKNSLLNKLNHVVIRVMAPLKNSTYHTWSNEFYDIGFKSIEMDSCINLTIENKDSIENLHCLSNQRTIFSIIEEADLDCLLQQSLNSFHNKFMLNNLKTQKKYLDYRTDSELFKWDDIIQDVPYPIVNAWYDPLHNTITMPIGISLFPIFRNSEYFDDAILGVVIGHELGHSLDHNGRLFDEMGNYVYNNTIDTENDDGLWFPEDLVKIKSQMDCLAKQYGHPCGNNDYGYHTMGEDIADQIGVLSGLLTLLTNKHQFLNDQYESLSHVYPITNTTLLREYFINYGRLWCGKSSVGSQCSQVETDPHALSKHRVNKTLKQIKAFLEAFECRDTSKMAENRNDMCIIYQ